MRRNTLMKGMLGVVAVCVAFGVSSLDVKPAAAADNFVLTEYLETSFMMDLGGSVRLKSETKEVTDENGNATKPFLLPQENPKKYYHELFDAYNVPDFTSEEVEFDVRAARKNIESDKRIQVTIR